MKWLAVVAVVATLGPGTATASQAGSAALAHVRVTVDRASLHERPATDGVILATLLRDEQPILLAEIGSWYRVRLTRPEGSKVGFLHSSIVERLPGLILPETDPPIPPASPVAQTPPQPVAASTGVVRVVVQVVDSDLNIKPVPQHVLLLARVDSSATPIRLVAGPDGRAEAAVAAGAYVLESEQPLDFQTHRYRWKRLLNVTSGNTTDVDLNVDSATDDRTPPSLAPAAAGVAAQSAVADLRGEWTGDYSGLPARLIVDRQSSSTFGGRLLVTVKPGKAVSEIAIAGVVTGSSVEIKETAVVQLGAAERWSLGTSAGVITSDHRQMGGTGKDGRNTYKWSFRLLPSSVSR